MSTLPLKIQAAHARYQEAQAALTALRHEHDDIFALHDELAAAYNESIVEMKSAYASNPDVVGKKFGDFSAKTVRTVDAEKLRELLEVLGVEPETISSIVTVKYSALKANYDGGVAAGVITDEISDAVEKFSTTISGPPTITVYKR